MRAGYFIAGVCACLWAVAGGLATEPAAKEAAQPKPGRPKITISKETTYITGPLRPDGYPDYLAALNAHCSRGVTPENNAAVPFWQAVGPKSIPAEMRPQFFKMLGIKELPEKGAYFVPLFDFVEMKTKDGKNDADGADGDDSIDRIWEEIERAEDQPWANDECPAVCAWLSVNELPLQFIVEGLKRPRFFTPLVVKEGGSMMDSTFMADMSSVRDVGRLLRIRSMLLLKAGKDDEARRNLLACHRLARLRGQGPFLVDQLVANSLETLACKSDAALAHGGKLTAKQATAWMADLKRLSPIRSGADIVEFGERYFGLDEVLLAARNGTGPKYIDFFDDEAVSKLTNDAIKRLNADPRVDWNAVLREMNAGYDALAQAHQRTTYKQRREAVAAEEKMFAVQERDMTQPGAVAKALDKDATPQSIGRRLGIVLRGSLTGTYQACLVAEIRQHTQVSLVQLTFALAGCRADHGKYPPILADLKPKYIAEIPKDLFTDKDIIYKPQDGSKGYVLYSVGPNGRDDGGLNANDDDSGKYDNVEFDKRPDDIVIRTPAAARGGAKK